MVTKKQKRANRKEFKRFSIVGFIATVIDYGILNVFANVLGFPLVAANAISATTSSYVSYTLNKKVVFKDKAHSERKTLLLYIGTLLVSILIIQSLVLWALGHGIMQGFVGYLGAEGELKEVLATNLSKVVAGLGTMAWNFLVQRRFVFESNDPSKN